MEHHIWLRIRFANLLLSITLVAARSVRRLWQGQRDVVWLLFYVTLTILISLLIEFHIIWASHAAYI